MKDHWETKPITAGFDTMPVSERAPLRRKTHAEISKTLRACLWGVLITLFVLSHVFTYKITANQYQPAFESSAPDNYPILPSLPGYDGSYTGRTAYGNTVDQNATDAIWDAFDDNHGVIAVDATWARSQNWADAKRHPYEPNKMVYLIEAYHQIHCLKMIRQALRASLMGKEDLESVHHSWHCFDALKQSFMCYADSTPLATTGDPDTLGIGQPRHCRDWDALMQWADENSACYSRLDKDPKFHGKHNKLPWEKHFGYCRSNNNDGLVQ